MSHLEESTWNEVSEKNRELFDGTLELAKKGFYENSDNTENSSLSISFLKKFIEENIEVFFNDEFTAYFHEIIRNTHNDSTKLWKKVKSITKPHSDEAFYQSVALLLFHMLNKYKLETNIYSNSVEEEINNNKTQIDELLRSTYSYSEENKSLQQRVNQAEKGLREIREILDLYVSKENTLENIAQWNIQFNKILLNVALEFEEENISNENIIEKISQLTNWYKSIMVVLKSLIKEKVLLKTTSWGYEINSTVKSALSKEKVITPSVNIPQQHSSKGADIIKAWDLSKHQIEKFELNTVIDDSEILKANLEIERLKKELSDAKMKSIDEETERKKLEIEIEQLKKDKEAEKKEKWRYVQLSKDLTWVLKKERDMDEKRIKEALKVYRENSK